MTEDLLKWALGIHGVILPLALAAFYRYSERSDLFNKSVGDTDELLARVRRGVTLALEEDLGPVFESAQSEPRIVLPTGYSERPTNPVGSAAFQDALRQFMEENVSAVVDYGRTFRARAAWCRWARVLSWAMLGLAFWEVLCVGVLAARLVNQDLSDSIPKLSFTPTAGLIILFFVCQGIMLRQHDVIYENKTRYPSL